MCFEYFSQLNMHLSWLGSTGVKIQAKPSDRDLSVIIDPYKTDTGNFPRSLTPDIALFSRGEKNSITLSGEPFVIATPGEFEIKGVLVSAVSGFQPGEIFFRVDAEGVSVGHLGLINQELKENQLEVLSDVDVLFIPVGGKNSLTADMAVKIINAIEPRMVIPMAYKSDVDPQADDLSVFLKAMGTPAMAAEKKIIIKKSQLPQEETKVAILEKE